MIAVVLMMALMVGCAGGSPNNDGEGEEEPEEEGDANSGNPVAVCHLSMELRGFCRLPKLAAIAEGHA